MLAGNSVHCEAVEMERALRKGPRKGLEVPEQSQEVQSQVPAEIPGAGVVPVLEWDVEQGWHRSGFGQGKAMGTQDLPLHLASPCCVS